MRIKNKIKKYIAIILILSISLISSVRAELTREKSGRYYEKPISYDIKNDFTGFYKNFIIELGGVRLALYDTTGNELWKFDILPKQFADKVPVYEIKTDYIESQESIILPYTYKLDLSNFKFSDNIPRLTQYMNGNEEISYVKFDEWTDWDEVWYWAEANNCENLIGLLTDLGVYENYNGNKYLNPNTNEEMDFITWFNTTNIDKKTYPSMLFEPLTFYPETTEQIYCSKLAIAGEYGMQWNSDFLLTITEHVQNNSDSEGGILGFFKGIADVISAIVDFFTKTVYYNVGVLEQITYGSEIEGISRAGYRDYIVDKIQEPKMINLTYTDTTTYSCDWKTEGFWKNFEGSKINVELDVSKEKAEAEYKAYELKCKSFNISSIYKNTKEYMESIGYRELSDGNYKSDIHMWEGIGDKSYIRTEHNKYWTWVPLYEGFEIVINTEKMLAGLGLLFSEPKKESNTTVYKYGAELFMSKMGVATESEIKIEFHPNGGQLSTEAGNYNKNKIDDSYTKIIKSNEKIKIDKTYYDNFFRDVYSDEHKYIRYNTKADMSGKYYSVDSKSSFTEDTVLYVDWSKNPPPPITAGTGFVLYEDELSYVYDYTDIGDDNTRKLQGKINSGGRQHPYQMCSHKICHSTSEGSFTVSVSHNFIGADKPYCVLDEQQTSIGDRTYSAYAREQDTPYFLPTGREINHTFVGYRDRVKDLRTAYKNDTKNTSNVNVALPKYSISYLYSPVISDWTGSKEWIDALGFPYTINISGRTGGCLANTHCNACIEWCESCDEDGNCHTYCCGRCDTYCDGGYVSGQLNSGMSYPLSNIKNTYDSVSLKQYSFVGNDSSYGDSIFPVQDHNTNGTITYEDRQASGTRQINIPDFNGIDYNYDNIAENGQAIGTYNAKELDTIEFYPFIRMKYKDTLSDNYNDAYILANNKTGVKNFVIAQVGMENIETSGSANSGEPNEASRGLKNTAVNPNTGIKYRYNDVNGWHVDTSEQDAEIAKQYMEGKVDLEGNPVEKRKMTEEELNKYAKMFSDSFK